METAELVAAEFGNVDIDVREALAPSEDAYDLVLELLSGAIESVLLVSHAPDVSLLSERLLRIKVASSFGPATVVALDVMAGNATLRFSIDPATLDA
jgi:phosphohistidine phosphatase SixA